jgi:hypothetical protein
MNGAPLFLLVLSLAAQNAGEAAAPLPSDATAQSASTQKSEAPKTDAPPPEADAPSSENSVEGSADAPAPKEPALFEMPMARAQLAFADHLFLDGDWYRSITEYRRYLFSVKGQGDDAARSAVAIGEALLRGEQFDAAGRQMDGVAQRASTLSLRRTALFGAGRAYLLDGRPELAKPRFRLLVKDEKAPETLREEAAWLLAWGHFDAGEMEAAEGVFDVVAQQQGRHAKQALGAKAALAERHDLELKSPLVAGLLSVVPGLGHIYLGQWAVGTGSFLWNALFITAATVAWIQGDFAVAAVLTIFELGWYAGSAFGAVAGTYRHNRDVIRNWRDDVLARYGKDRELPDMSTLSKKEDADPGSLIRLGGRF